MKAMLIISLVLFLALVGDRTTRVQTSRLRKRPRRRCDDISIIGAGIAGSYAAWRLKSQGKKITVYEYSDRIGGKCHTIQFPGIPDVNIELGAMRFLPQDHPLMNRTIHALGLTVKDFKPGLGFNPDSLLYLRGHHMRYKDLANINVPVPYRLEEPMRIDFKKLNWEIFANNTNINPEDEGFMDDPMQIRSKDGVELWKQSTKGFHFKYLTADEAAYVQDIGPFDSVFGNVSAVKVIPRPKPAENTGPPKPVKTVLTGFQSIPETMVKGFLEASRKHRLKKNHHLKSITKHGDRYILSFRPTETTNGVTREIDKGHYKICTKKILLAVGRLALENIDWEGLKQPEIQDFIHNSVFDTHAGRLFFASPDQWWAYLDRTPHLTVSDTPLRQTFDYAHSKATRMHVLNAGYMDSKTYFWREMKGQGFRYPGTSDDTAAVSTSTVDTARKFLAEVYSVNVEQIPLPLYAAMKIWDSYPFGAAWNLYKPGYDMAKVEAKMIRPSVTDDVFISSSAFLRKMSTWAEGALEKVEQVLKYLEY